MTGGPFRFPLLAYRAGHRIPFDRRMVVATEGCRNLGPAGTHNAAFHHDPVPGDVKTLFCGGSKDFNRYTLRRGIADSLKRTEAFNKLLVCMAREGCIIKDAFAFFAEKKVRNPIFQIFGKSHD